MNQRYVLTTVKLKDLLSHKVQTQNLLFTFTWNVKRPQINFVPIFNSKVGVRLIHECDLYSSKYGKFKHMYTCIFVKALIHSGVNMITQECLDIIMKFEYNIVNENISDEVDSGHCSVKVKVTT